jgi:two-component system chemotaxis response regulator CheB
MENKLTSAPKIRVVVADDSATMRKTLSMILTEQDDIEVVAEAVNGQEAIDFAKRHRPDILVLDVEMPVKDGIEVLKELRKTGLRTKTILVSSLTQRFAPVTVQGLALGAVGYIPKPTASEKGRTIDDVAAKLLDLIRNVAAPSENQRYAHATEMQSVVPAEMINPPFSASALQISIAVMASSTGGPNALSLFLDSITAPVPFPVVLVQHMPKIFLPQLAERLSSESKIPVLMAEDNLLLKPGHFYVAPGEIHTKVERDHDGNFRSHLFDGPAEQFCKPSANPLFRSAAVAAKQNCLALVFTGMGSDGLHGAHMVRRLGGTVIVQDKESSVVWGMPGAIAAAGLANAQLKIEEMAGVFNTLALKKSKQ